MRKLFSLITAHGFETLFFTNLWINIYLFLLRFLNSKFSVRKVQDSNNYVSTYMKPEPYEIPLYILTSLVLVLLMHIFYLHKKFVFELIKKIIPSKLFVLKYIMFLLLLLQFLNSLSVYPGTEIRAIPGGYFFLYIFSVIFIIFLVNKFNQLLVNSKWAWSIFLIVILIIAFFTLEPGFPSSPGNYHLFFGPIYEIVHGKTIYTQVPSLYGFLSIVFFGFLSKLGFGISYLPFAIWFLFIFEYFICFYLLYKFSKSVIFSLLGLFSILTINHFSLVHLAAQAPQIAFRWPQLISVIFLFYFFKNIISKRLIFLVALLSYWTVDVGAALLLTYLFTLGIFFLKKVLKFKQILFACFLLFVNLIIIFVGINLFHLSVGYEPVDPSLVFGKLTASGISGLFMEPMQSKNFFWVLILIYIICLVYFLRKKLHTTNDLILMFAANTSLFVSIYYVGESIEHNLLYLSIFPILNAFLLMSFFIKRISKKKLKIFFAFIFILFIFLPAYLSGYLPNIVKKKIDMLKTTNYLKPELDSYLDKEYKDERDLIGRNLPSGEIIILSSDSTYFFMSLERDNLLYANPYHALYNKTDVNRALSGVKYCQKKIAVSCSMFNSNCKENLVYSHWEKRTLFAMLENLEKICSAKYSKGECTQRLCIGEIK